MPAKYGSGIGPTQLPYWVETNPLGPKISPYRVVQSLNRPQNTTQWVVVAGPFPSKQDAAQWINEHEGHFPSIPNPLAFLAWIQDIGHWVATAVAYVTDGAMWRSLGWLALGFIMLLSGVLLWILKTTDTKSLGELGGLLLAAA